LRESELALPSVAIRLETYRASRALDKITRRATIREPKFWFALTLSGKGGIASAIFTATRGSLNSANCRGVV